MYRKFGEIYICGLRYASGSHTDWQTNKQTNRHTVMLITILHTPTGGKVITDIQ